MRHNHDDLYAVEKHGPAGTRPAVAIFGRILFWHPIIAFAGASPAVALFKFNCS
jgi:hypothetical protein